MNLWDYVPMTPEEQKAVLDEMIEKVDRSRLIRLLQIAASDDKKKRGVSLNSMEALLLRWAVAKLPYYTLFGRNLTSSIQTDEILDKEDLKARTLAFAKKHPSYEAFILCQDPISVAKNKEPHEYPGVPEFSKMSRFFAWQFRDQKFDNDYAEFLEQKREKEYVRISIDPYDYLTMSINQHNWISCHNIENGCYATGGLSYMTDEATMIAYREDGKEYSYEILGAPFKGNSKKWRQCVYMDPETCSVLFSRQYPQGNSQSESISAVRSILTRQLKALNPDYTGAHVDTDDFALNDDFSEAYINYEAHTGNFNYHDIACGYDSDSEYIGEKVSRFKVGSQVYCPICGNPLNRNNTHSPVGCSFCLNKEG